MFTQDYKQKVTYWSAPSVNGWGAMAFSAPVVLMGRWENVVEKLLTYKGEEAISRANVWLKQDVELGGYLFLGESLSADPLTVKGAYEIMMFHRVPDLRNAFTERRVVL